MHKIVAIVGKANVGKSRLFNRLTNRRDAIVSDKKGITRDRHYKIATYLDKEFVAVDTGGLELSTNNNLEKEVTNQSIKAIKEADIIICVFDGRSEPTNYDYEIVEQLRKLKKPVFYAVNKVDTGDKSIMASYFAMGEDLNAISAEHGIGVNSLMDKIYPLLPQKSVEIKNDDSHMKVAIIGRPNTGKSTLLNQIIQDERSVVSDIPGTTRDAINVEVNVDGEKCYLIDTAGIRRKKGDKVEWITSLRSVKVMSSSDVACLLIDAKEGIVHQDLELASLAIDEGRCLMLAINKWDLVDYGDKKEFEEDIRYRLGEMRNTPIVFISAKSGMNCDRILPTSLKLYKNWKKRISTSKTNEILRQAYEAHQPTSHKGRHVKLFYATQVSFGPPVFVVFTNYPEYLNNSYRRYLASYFRDALGGGVPVRIDVRKKSK